LDAKNGTDTEFSVPSALCMFRSIIQNQKGLVIELVLVTVVSSKEQKVYALVSIKIQESTQALFQYQNTGTFVLWMPLH
jgi:hypothetical protein